MVIECTKEWDLNQGIVDRNLGLILLLYENDRIVLVSIVTCKLVQASCLMRVMLYKSAQVAGGI